MLYKENLWTEKKIIFFKYKLKIVNSKSKSKEIKRWKYKITIKLSKEC